MTVGEGLNKIWYLKRINLLDGLSEEELKYIDSSYPLRPRDRELLVANALIMCKWTADQANTAAYPCDRNHLRNFTGEFQVINDTVNGIDLVVVGSSGKNLAVSFNAYWFAWAAFFPGADVRL